VSCYYYDVRELQSLVECKQAILAAEIPNLRLSEEDFELSMGMSGDFETAVSEFSILVYPIVFMRLTRDVFAIPGCD
jgi:hypothetical protein